MEAGSGSSPEQKLESMALSFQSDEIGVNEIAKKFRMSFIPVIGYISENIFYIDLKALLPRQNIKLAKIIEYISKMINLGGKKFPPFLSKKSLTLL